MKTQAFRSSVLRNGAALGAALLAALTLAACSKPAGKDATAGAAGDRKSTRLNSSHRT